MANFNKIGRTVARNTAKLRKNAKLSLSDMERATGVSRRTLARIETAHSDRSPYIPSLKTVVKLAETAGVSVDTYVSTAV